MSKKVLVANYEKCSGCRMCEVVCSWYHKNEFNPAKSAIQIISIREKSIDIPIICQQCDKAMCQISCKQKAIIYRQEYNAYVIDEDKCTGCKVCMQRCPIGAISYDIDKGVAIKCDLCKGEPQCVKYCPMDALKYLESEEIRYKKKYIVVTKLVKE